MDRADREVTTPVVTPAVGSRQVGLCERRGGHVDGRVARSDGNEHRAAPRIAHGRAGRWRVHPARTAHRAGRSGDSGWDRRLQPPRCGGLCGGGGLPVGLRNDNRGGYRLPGPNGQLPRGQRIGHRHRLGSGHCTRLHSGSRTERSKRRPRRRRALGLWCDVAKPGRSQQRGSLAQRGAREPGQLHDLGRQRWKRQGPGARRGRSGPHRRHPHRRGLQRCFGWRPDHDDNGSGADDNVDHRSPDHNDDHRAPNDNDHHRTTDDDTTTSAPTTTTTTPHDEAPRFTSDGGTTFRHGIFGTFTVTASGSPQPSLKVSGSLPSGVSFDRTTGVLSGTPRNSGVYRVTFTASNGTRPNATQSFTLIVE